MIIKFPESADVDMEMFGGNRDTVKQVKTLWKDVRTRWLQGNVRLDKLADHLVDGIVEASDIDTDHDEEFLDGQYINKAFSGELYREHKKACDEVFRDRIGKYKKVVREWKKQIDDDVHALEQLQELIRTDDRAVKKFINKKWMFAGKLDIEFILTDRLPQIFALWRKLVNLKPETAAEAVLGISIIKTGKQDRLSEEFILLDLEDPRITDECPVCLVDNGTNQLVHMWMDY